MKNSLRFPPLLKAAIFDGVDTQFKKDFINACRVATYERPTLIYQQGQPAGEVMILAHGYVDVSFMGESGAEMFVIRLRPGTVIADMEVISDLPCMSNCKTSANAILLKCPRAQLDLALQQPAFLKNTISAYYQRLSYVNWSKYMAQFGSVDERLRGYLYVLSEHTSTIRDTQTFLANMIGCSRQTINRELGVLRDAGLVELGASEITVLNRKGLMA